MTNASTTQIRVGFIGVAIAFATALAFTTLPAPLWSLYAQRDSFSSLMIAVVFAAYAVGVALSLFLVGHISDWYGRRRVLLPALLLNLGAAVVFLLWPALPGLLVARVISGLGIGAVNATATAWLMELHAAYAGRDRQRAELVAAGANLGGLGVGALVSGLLAQWVGDPLTVPFLVLIAALLVAVVMVLRAPETRRPVTPRPSYRPQRISVPPGSRGHFLAAAIPGMLLGLALLTLAVWLPHPSLAVFLAGVLIAGFAGGLTFKGAIGTVSALSAPDQRSEALAGMFLAAYLGLAGPVIGLGVLTQFVSARLSMLVFAALLSTVMLLATPRLLDAGHSRRSRRHRGFAPSARRPAPYALSK